jgi:SAM-dependent methyltransferase
MDGSLNIGCLTTSWGTIRLDRVKVNRPEVVGTVLFLPFQDESFRACTFTDVVEHLPVGSEQRALKEICRVLKPGGWVLVTAPNSVKGQKFFDLFWWWRGHRHYTRRQLVGLLHGVGFVVDGAWTTGEPYREIVRSWVRAASFLWRRVRGVLPPWPSEGAPSDLFDSDLGYTVFVAATKRAKNGTASRPGLASGVAK